MFGLISSKKSFLSALEKLVKEKIFSVIDFMFAEKILKNNFATSENEALALAYIFFISRKGHICVDISTGHVSPSVSILFQEKQKNESFDIEKLEKKIFSGLQVLIEQYAFDKKSSLRQQLISFENKLYLQKHWLYEAIILQQLQRLIAFNNKESLDKEKLCSRIAELLKEKKLTDTQSSLIEHLFQHHLFLLSGGPGTGKTYLASYIVKLFLECSYEKKQIAVVAPTGKAAALLKDKLIPLLSEENRKDVTFGTLHALLNINKNSRQVFNLSPLRYDLYLIDEASMIDATVMARLLNSIKTQARMILIGDANQLPPIEMGNIFFDLVNSPVIKNKQLVQFLQHPFRFENEEIGSFIKAISNNDKDRMFYMMLQGHSVKYWSLQDEKKAQKDLIEETQKYFFRPSWEQINIRDCMEKMEEFRLLTSLNKGLLGCSALNKEIFLHLHETIKNEQWWVIPLIITRNDYHLELFNGMLGIAVGKKQKQNFFSSTDQCYFFDEKKQIRKVPLSLLSSYEYAYCLTVHKTQGSEFKNVVLVLPSGSEFFGKEMLYTAVTRVKHQLTIISEEKIMHDLMQNKERKISGIISRKDIPEDITLLLNKN